MQAVEDDVYLCGPAAPLARDLAARLALGLTQRGFRVHRAEAAEVPAPNRDDRLHRIGETPDFVLLHTPETFDASLSTSAVLNEVAHALATRRHVVIVSLRGLALPAASHLPDGLAGLMRCPIVAWDPDRASESVSRLARGLSSDLAVGERRLMRRFKRLFAAAVLAVLAGVLAQALPGLIKDWTRPGPKPPVPPFALSWTAFGKRVQQGRWVEFPVTDRVRLLEGDEVRVVFSPSADGHAYVVSRDARGRVAVLFPSDMLSRASRVRAGQEYSAPVAAGWLTIDRGMDLRAIYLIAGYDPLQNIEELVEEPETATTHGSRRELLDSTIAGLLDGRHAVWGRDVWTGSGQIVDKRLPLRRPLKTAAAWLTAREQILHGLVTQTGMVHAAVELRLGAEGGPVER